MQIFIRGLSWDVSEKAIFRFFDGYDPLCCRIIRSASNACALVEISGGEKGSAAHALKVLGDELFDGVRISLSEVFRKE